MESLVLALVIGLGVGCIVGALGAGGGILSVPALVYLLGQSPHAAAVGSLIIVGSTALISLVPRGLERRVRWKNGIIFGLCSTVATVVGSRLSFWISGRVLMLMFAVLLTVVGVVMIWKAFKPAGSGGSGKSSDSGGSTPAAPQGDTAASMAGATGESGAQNGYRARDWTRLIAAASFTGLLTGFFGVGGGFIVVPMLVLALRFNIREASATSLLVMLIASVSGLLSRIGAPLEVEWPVVIAFALTSMVGGLIGAPVSRRVRETALTTAFGMLLLLVAAGTLVAELS